VLTPYPQIVEYNEAVQHPAAAFRDPELRASRVAVNALGLPVALSGAFALTYPMAAPRRRRLALRCFIRAIPAAESKYRGIAGALKGLRSPYFAGFEYLADGIRIRGGFYPVLKMDWVAGEPLGIWLESRGGDRRALEALRSRLGALAAFLEGQGIAHGDIQNGNVIVSRRGELQLVDYDGMFVPGMPVSFGCETGHKHFQHPGRSVADFGPRIDRFSFIAIDVSLAALAVDPSLYARFSEGGETIVFRAADFANPERSPAFAALAQHEQLRPLVERFAAVCRADVADVPSLDEFRAGGRVPATTRASIKRGAGRARSNREIVEALRSAASQWPPPLSPGSPPTAMPMAPSALVQARPLLRRRAESPVNSSGGGGSRIPTSGSFVIHPRSRRPPPPPPPAGGAPPEPGLWQRILHFLGLHA
jgi:hypothetical protein